MSEVKIALVNQHTYSFFTVAAMRMMCYIPLRWAIVAIEDPTVAYTYYVNCSV